LKVVANLFLPQNSRKYIITSRVGGWVMTGVKEQVAGHYAERIAKAGYVTLVLDHRHFGESEGIPRPPLHAKLLILHMECFSCSSCHNNVDSVPCPIAIIQIIRFA